MHAIPSYIRGVEVDPTGEYSCPLCRTQHAGDEADTGWVRCLMMEGAFICLGCCIDHQSVARADDFEGHVYRAFFDTVSERTGRPRAQLRTTCLEHQRDIAQTRIEESPERASEFERLQSAVARALSNLEGRVENA